MLAKVVLLLAALLPALVRAEGRVVYESNWTKPEQAVGPEWRTEHGWVQISPNGARTFLGNLRGKGASFIKKELPPHKVVHLEFDLIIRGSWDGAVTRGNADRAIVKLKDGRTLLASSFRTYAHDRQRQSYPYRHDSGFMTLTHYGAAEQHSLGYIWTNSSDEHWKVDTIYHLDWFVPHEDAELEWKIFCELGEDDRMQDMWVGLDKVKVSVLGAEHRFTDAEWGKLATDLESVDPLMADRACWQMLRAPTRARAWLDGGAATGDAEKRKKLGVVVAALGDKEFGKRRRAAEKLLQVPPEDLGQLRVLHAGENDEVVKMRLGRIMKEIELQIPGGKGRYWRARLEELLSPPAAEKEAAPPAGAAAGQQKENQGRERKPR